MNSDFEIPDRRIASAADYQHRHRRGRFLRSWSIGARRRRDGPQTVSFRDGFTWGSIGQILGYLLGDIEENRKRELFDQLLAQYWSTDRGKQAFSLRFATWNLRYCTKQAPLRAKFLQALDWDIIALQEVSQKAWKAFSSEGIFEQGFYTFSEFNLDSEDRRKHGAAILARKGFRLSEPELIPGLPKSERALAVKLDGYPSPITIVSWHAPNAAGERIGPKMQAYEAITDWLEERTGLIILGFDGNHWNLNVDLAPPDSAGESNEWYQESSFFSATPRHRLQDALLAYYRRDVKAYNEALVFRPNGPLAVSYQRGSSRNPVLDRFDYVFVSPEIDVDLCYYDSERGLSARSDHGIVIADLTIPN
jgi:exonuclease III